MANDDVIYRFLDKGAIPGIYARDLTQADFDRLTLLQQRDVRAGTLYAPVTKPKAPETTTPPKGDEKKGGN